MTAVGSHRLFSVADVIVRRRAALASLLSPTAKDCSLNYLKTGSAKRNLKRIISSDARAQSAISKELLAATAGRKAQFKIQQRQVRVLVVENDLVSYNS